MRNKFSLFCDDRKCDILLFYYGAVTGDAHCYQVGASSPYCSVSYEIIKLAGNSDNPVVNLLSKPGMWVQNMTTKEPDDSMIEVAICAVEKVFDWREWQEKNNEL